MSDGTTLNPGAAGDKIATDDLGAVGKAQWVKLMDGTDGGTDVIPGTAASGLRVDPGPVSVADGGALPAKGLQIGGTDGSVFQVLSVDSAGRPNVNINGAVDTELPAAAALADGAANPTAPAVGAFGLLWNGATWDRAPGAAATGLLANLKALNGTTVDTNSGSKSAGTQRVVLATDQPALTAALKVDPSAVTSPVSLASLPALAAGSALAGRVNVDPQTANGLTPSKVISAASTNATSVKGSAGQVYTILVTNTNAAVRYLKLYDKATAPTVGTDVPKWTIPIPGNTAGAGVAIDISNGLAFAVGIGLALTTGVADADTGAVAANEIVVNLGTK